MVSDAHIRVAGPDSGVEMTVPWSTTVGEIFDQAKSQLGIPVDGLEFWCGDGTSMSNKMERTLEELRERRICPRQEYAIRPIGHDGAG